MHARSLSWLSGTRIRTVLSLTILVASVLFLLWQVKISAVKGSILSFSHQNKRTGLHKSFGSHMRTVVTNSN